MKTKFITACLILIGAGKIALAENLPVKFGKVSEAELKMKVYDKDTSASAVILCDYGETFFEFSQKGFAVTYKMFRRIKILKKEGYDYAKHSIYLYKSNDGTNDVSRIKGFTYNLDDNGTVVKTKLEKSNIFREQTSKRYNTFKFEMPAVKEGSVIEYEYSVMTPFWSIPDWYFQSEIPTVYSEYEVRIPEYFYYKQLEKGYFSITEHNTSTRNQSYQDLRYYENVYDYVCKDVPAFKEEANMTCAENYMTSIAYELGSFNPPYGMVKNYSNTWESISKTLLKDEDFGMQINGGMFLNGQVDLINNTSKTDEEKVEAAYSYIRQYMNWNNKNGIYSYDGIRNAFNEKTGNCADINLMLVSLLKRLKFDAQPVILSTRDNGFIHPAQILLEQFNYVVASVKLNDKILLLDATDKFLPMGMLPERCLNEKGRTITEGGGDWVPIQPEELYKKAYQVSFTIDKDGMVKGHMTEKQEGYAALNKRHDLQYYTNEDEYLKKYQENNPGMEITLDSITGKEQLIDPLTIYYEFESDKQTENAGNLLLINPYIAAQSEKNPYKLEQRDYPVDYSYNYSITYMVTITIPDGFTPENLPAPTRFILPGNSASFMYNVQKNGNSIVLISKFEIKKVIFLPTEYGALKEFYNKMIEIEKQQIVLKAI